MTCRMNYKRYLFSVLILIICGLFLIALAVFVLFVDDAAADDPSSAFFLLIFGLISLLLGLRESAVNKKACIHADEDGIEAYISYWLILHRISCKYGEIISVKLYGDTLTVRCIDMKKDFQMSALENCGELYRYIRSRIQYQKPKAGIDELKTTVADLESRRKTALIKFVVCLVLFIAAFAAVIITAVSKDISDFNRRETTFFVLAILSFAVISAALCVNTIRGARVSSMFLRSREELIQFVLRKTPPSGDAVAMYLNDMTDDPYRCVVYRLHRSEEAYVVLETVNKQYNIERVAESSVFPNLEAVYRELEDMIEIPVSRIS